MRRALPVVVLLALLALAASGPASAASEPRAAATGVRPTAWVQREALWQSLAAGDAQPGRCSWTLTTPARAAGLTGATSYLRSLPGFGRVWVVVVNGRFSSPHAPGGQAQRLFLVMTARDHVYLAQGVTSARHLHVRSLGSLHHCLLRQPLVSGLWGQAMLAGGPAPGGPRPLAHTKVIVWQGPNTPAGDPALTRARSDWAGFFHLQLAPGTYTLRLDLSDAAPVSPTTVTVAAGKAVAAGVYEDVP